MSKLLLIAITAALLCACEAQPVSVSSTNNPSVPVALLFEHDGCKVYRFKDDGRTLYFSKCEASAGQQLAQSTTTWSESCGKNCVRDVSITTGDGQTVHVGGSGQ